MIVAMIADLSETEKIWHRGNRWVDNTKEEKKKHTHTNSEEIKETQLEFPTAIMARTCINQDP